MTTAANVKKADSSHWYYTDGTPCYELPKKDGSGMKVPTLADARKLNLLPSVTTILQILHKQALVEWLIEQAVLAVMTTPRNAGEPDDAFIERVLRTERVQDQESQRARDIGKEIHDAMECYFQIRTYDPSLQQWFLPAAQAIEKLGKVFATERCLVGDGYAGKTDLVLEAPDCWWVWDYKTTKKLPDPNKGGAWKEHVLQAAAYARALVKLLEQDGHDTTKPIKTGNLYISTVEPGKFSLCIHQDDWMVTYANGFRPLVEHWQWDRGYEPVQKQIAVTA